MPATILTREDGHMVSPAGRGASSTARPFGMILNGKWCEPGTVVYIPADEDYWHSTGAECCVVASMRPSERGKTRRAAEAAAAE